jgi:hypothetical protein
MRWPRPSSRAPTSSRVSRRALLAALLLAAGAHAQPAVVEVGSDPAPVLSEYGRRVRSIEVRGLWLRRVALPIARCDVLTPETLSAAREALRVAADARPAGGDGTGLRVIYVDHQADLGPGQGDECGAGVPTVALTLRPLVVDVSLQRVGDNVLPVPHPPLPALGDLAPALRAIDPQIGMAHDRAFGTAMVLGAEARLGAGQTASVDLAKSLDEKFYRGDVALAGRRQMGGTVWREARWRLAAANHLEPLVADAQRSDTVEIGAGSTWNLAATTHLLLDGSWRRTTDQRDSGGPSETLRELGGRVLLDSLRRFDSHPPAFVRAALWADDVRSPAGNFRRWSLRAGYAQEIRTAPGQTLGVDVVAGAGRIDGTPSTDQQFYGGNSAAQFLYDGAASPALLHAPRGPLLRSFGERQASLAANAGGRAYWHVNVNLALPVRAWSRPLIPDEDTGLPGEGGSTLTLKQMLRKQIDRSGPSLMVEALVKQGLPRDDAQRQADQAFAEIDPAVHYIIDDAPLVAVRPLLLLDIASLSRGPGGESARWSALGAGIGVTVVAARIEAGYMRTLSGPVDAGRRGAAFLRVVFQNLF